MSPQRSSATVPTEPHPREGKLRNFSEVRQAAQRRQVGRRPLVVAVASADANSIAAVVAGRRAGFCDAVLLGHEPSIRREIERHGAEDMAFEVIFCADDEESAVRAVGLARRGQAGLILKGNLATSTLLRAVLDRNSGLRTGRLLSDVRLCDHPFKAEGFLSVTDGGMNPQPRLAAKRAILENAIRVYHRLGWAEPRVAVLCAAETVDPKIPATVDAAALKELQRSGEITGCVVEGPIALDLALSSEAAALKGYSSPVAGEADILLGPSIEANNLLGKAMVYFLHSLPGQIVVGARVPVLITSRADGPEVRLNSIALAAVAGDGAAEEA
jgi:phosphate butyryltransferase